MNDIDQVKKAVYDFLINIKKKLKVPEKEENQELSKVFRDLLSTGIVK